MWPTLRALRLALLHLTPRKARSRRCPAFRRLLLETLEDRLAPATLTVSSLGDGVSGTAATLDLREAILLVNSGGTATDTSGNSLSAAKVSQVNTTQPFGSNDTIQFDAGLSGQTITLRSALPALSANVAIMGLGAANLAVSGAGQYSIFQVNSGVTASISGLDITAGEASQGGGVYNAGTLTVSDSVLTNNRAFSQGGDIYNVGTLTISNSGLQGAAGGSPFGANPVGSGGDIFNGGTLTVNYSAFTDSFAAYAGGGIDNTGTLAVSNSTFDGGGDTINGGIYNSSSGTGVIVNSSFSGLHGSLNIGNGGGGFDGGAIDNAGALTVAGCSFSGNSVPAGDGGGIDNTGTLTVSGSTFYGNRAAGGGGIFNFGTLTVSNSTFSENESSDGGGIANTGALTVSNSTFSGNSTGTGTNNRGGGIGSFLGGWMTVVNSTFYSNNASEKGGAIFFSSTSPHQSVLTNVTIAENWCNFLPFAAGGGIWVDPNSTAPLTLNNTIVADNFNEASTGASPTADDIAGVVGGASADNLIGAGGAGGLQNGANGNQVGVAGPGLGSLAYYGGPTQTQTVALLPGSPAIGAGSVALSVDADGNPLTFDQRGFARTYNGTVDIGAYEAQPLTFPATFVVTNTNDSGPGSLRQAVLDADQHDPFESSPPTISFVPGLTGTITLTSGELLVSQDLTIDGPGAGQLAVSANGAGRVFEIASGATASVSGLTIENGQVNNFIDVPATAGGGISNRGTLTVSNCTFSGNSAPSGGGIDNMGTLSVTDCTFSGNSAGAFGGGIKNDGSLTVLTVTNSTFSGNYSPGDGGGIYTNGFAATVTDCTFSGNSASSGGGLYYNGFNNFAVLTLTNVTIANNQGVGMVVMGGSGAPYPSVNNSILANNFSGLSKFPLNIVGLVDPASADNLIVGNLGRGGVLIDVGGLQNGVNGNHVGVFDPGLAPLGSYGGPTQTIALLPGSPAIGAGSVALAVDADGNPLTYDQRGPGFSRTVNGTVDIGAFQSAGLSLEALIQQVLSPSYPVSLLANTSADADAVISAVNQLPSYSGTPVTVTLDLAADASYSDLTPSPPPGVTLVINGQGGTTIVVGQSPALTVSAGTVIVTGITFTTATDAPTILVSGGHLTLRNCTIQESTGYSDHAIVVTGGTVDLGTASSPGGNTLNINGAGIYTQNATSDPIPQVGDTFAVNGTPVAPSNLSGVVWEDFNDDGQVDFGENGISGVTITLTGTDVFGNAVNLSQTTDSDGAYVFLNLCPGSYYLTETPPPGDLQGTDSIGTAGGSVSATDQFFVALGARVNGLNYNFGELPPAGGGVHHGQTAAIGFWNNKNGQALILALNGGTGTQLANWLAATLPNMFGVNAGTNNLTGKSNAAVAALFQQDFLLKGVKLDAQVLATALSVYATNATLDATGVAAQYGFTVSGNGVGTATVNVGSNGDACGVANNTVLTVMDLLLATDEQAVNGVLYGGNTTRRNEANSVYSAVNQAGGIS
jgi:hypothetical protein